MQTQQTKSGLQGGVIFGSFKIQFPTSEKSTLYNRLLSEFEVRQITAWLRQRFYNA